jgi:hypothetical protein
VSFGIVTAKLTASKYLHGNGKKKSYSQLCDPIELMSSIERLFASGIPSMAQLARQKKEGNIAKGENKNSDDSFVKAVPEQTHVSAPPKHSIPPSHSRAPPPNIVESTPIMEENHSKSHTSDITIPTPDRMLSNQISTSTAAIGNMQQPINQFTQGTSHDRTSGQAAHAKNTKANNANGVEDSRKKKKKNKGKGKVCSRNILTEVTESVRLTWCFC